MYSDRNFEIRPREKYVDPEETQTNPSRVFIAVVILFAVLLGAACLGWLWSFTQVNPSTSTSNPQRSRHEYFQEQRRSPARSGGGERSGDPPAERSTATQRGAQEAPQNKVVVAEQGALAPSFQWVMPGRKLHDSGYERSISGGHSIRRKGYEGI